MSEENSISSAQLHPPANTKHLEADPTIRFDANEANAPYSENSRNQTIENIRAGIARENLQKQKQVRHTRGSRTINNLVSFVKDTILSLPHGQNAVTRELLNAMPGTKNGPQKPSTVELGSVNDHLPQELGQRYMKQQDFAGGGQGTIALAKDQVLHRTIALKSLRPEHLENLAVRNAFINEALITAQLEHPAIISIYSLMGDDKNGLHLAMQFIRGKTLHDVLNADMNRLEEKRPSHWEYLSQLHRRCQTVIRVCEAIAYAHSKGIIHCDLKPENIMFGEYGGVYVMDWGIARRVGESRSQLDGTPRYMPPEVFENGERTVSGDIYALGMILFEIAAMRAPYAGCTTREIIQKIRSGERNRIENVYGMPIPAALAAIINKATAFRQDDRYPTVQALTNDLRLMLEDEPVSALPENLMTSSLRTFKRYSRTFLLLLLAGWLTVLGFSLHSLKKLHFDTTQRLAQMQSMNASLRNARMQGRIDQELAAVDHNMLRGASLLGNGFYAASMQLQSLAEGLGHVTGASSPQSPLRTASLPAFPCTAIADPASEAHAAKKSLAYGANINPMTCSYDAPAETRQDEIDAQLAWVAPLSYMLRRIVLASSGYPLNSKKNEEILTAYMLDTGLPINRAYICLDSTGLCLAYPFDHEHRIGVDARRSTWYNRGYQTFQDGELASSQAREFVLSDNGGIQRITCSVPIVNSEHDFVGVVAFDMQLDHFQKLLAHGITTTTPNYVTDRYLVTPGGVIVCAVHLHDPLWRRGQGDEADSDTPEQMAEMLALRHNILSLISEGNDATHREFNDMGEKYFMHCAYIPGMNMFLAEKTDPNSMALYMAENESTAAGSSLPAISLQQEETP